LKTLMKQTEMPVGSGIPDYNLAVCVLASGSKGNAIYLSNGSVSVLIDAGLSGIEIERRLESIDVRPKDINAIILTHEHVDHVRGVGVLSRRFGLPVYLTDKTRKAATNIGTIDDVKVFGCGSPFKIDNMTFHPFSVSHDAEDPVGFTVKHNEAKIGIATDLGIATAMVKEHLKDCSLLVLEANHDPSMLVNGPYPWPLKQRIKGRKGHLSNEESKELLMEVQHNRLKYVVLAHLSETNNTSQRAFDIVCTGLNGCNAQIVVATQDSCGELLYL
jgi:phosphoribosyl 1,2-cyclic phosphodiesterase